MQLSLFSFWLCNDGKSNIPNETFDFSIWISSLLHKRENENKTLKKQDWL
jgi:hypothetical protein